MGASSAPRRQNCRGWEKRPLQGCGDALTGFPQQGWTQEQRAINPTPVDQQISSVGTGEMGLETQGGMKIPIRERG